MSAPLIVLAVLSASVSARQPSGTAGEAAAAPPGPGAEGATEEESRLHLDLGVDVLNAYIDRGVVIEDDGWIVQPWADAYFDLVKGEAATVSLYLGTWHSLHGEPTDAGTTDSFREHWYEADFYAGVRWESGRWALTPAYNYYISPSDAWEDLAEVSVALEFDDSELLGDWTLSPTALVAVETGPRSNDGFQNGVYLELGVEPAYTLGASPLGDVTVSLPLTLGLSPDEYYEDETGGNDFFGFLSVGLAASVPLPAPGGLGEWSLTAGVRGVFLGDVNTDLNGGDGTEVLASVGVEVSF